VVIRRLFSTTAAVSLVTFVAAFALAPAAGASCAGDWNIERAIANGDTVFVGTVLSTSNAGHWAVFTVEKVVAGHPGETVMVKSGPSLSSEPILVTGSEEERTYEAHARYLVDGSTSTASLVKIEPGELLDSGCSATQPWSGSLDGVPSISTSASQQSNLLEATAAGVGRSDATGPLGWAHGSGFVAGLGVALVAVVGVVLVARRRGRDTSID
jgi:hypothetical protein